MGAFSFAVGRLLPDAASRHRYPPSNRAIAPPLRLLGMPSCHPFVGRLSYAPIGGISFVKSPASFPRHSHHFLGVIRPKTCYTDIPSSPRSTVMYRHETPSASPSTSTKNLLRRMRHIAQAPRFLGRNVPRAMRPTAATRGFAANAAHLWPPTSPWCPCWRPRHRHKGRHTAIPLLCQAQKNTAYSCARN